MSASTENCPKCGAVMPVNAGYVTWCSSCNWNLNPKRVESKMTLVERLNRRIGEQAMQSVYDEAISQEQMKHPWTLNKVVAYLFATCIHGCTLLCFSMAITHIYFLSTVADMFLGLIFGFISYQLFPRFGKVPKSLLPRSQYPTLYRLLDSMAETLNTRPIQSIVMTREYNAYFTEAGLSRTRIVGIGLPLFSALTTEEKVAILAHELSHNANRDITRGWYVGRAIGALSVWYSMIAPSDEYYDYDDLPFRGVWIRKKLASLIFWMWYLLGISVWRESQRAEYYADRSAANLAGTKATVTALEKLNFAPTYDLTLERVAQFRYTKELFDEFRSMTKQVPSREKERLDRIIRIDSARLDATHPPTRLRIDYLNYFQTSPWLVLDISSKEKLAEEFAMAEKSMQSGILDDYRSWYL